MGKLLEPNISEFEWLVFGVLKPISNTNDRKQETEVNATKGNWKCCQRSSTAVKGIDGGLPLFDVLPFKERILSVFEKSGILSRLTKHRSTFQMIMDV